MGEQDTLCANNVSKRLPRNPGELAYTKYKNFDFLALGQRKGRKICIKC